ncbi:MAG: flagellar assembly protein FliW [Fimbriimonadaceae bacterium]|nr:flagellar assembly protein FliW [Fimbriimonadaceae bacterium]
MTTNRTYTSLRFGELNLEPDDIILFEAGLVGFPNLREFVFVEHKPGSHFLWMQSLDAPEIAYLVVDPGKYIANYSPAMPAVWAHALELNEETPRLVYTIVNIPSGQPELMTMNLAGPIVINAENRKAGQIVLEDEMYSIRHRVFPDSAAA